MSERIPPEAITAAFAGAPDAAPSPPPATNATPSVTVTIGTPQQVPQTVVGLCALAVVKLGDVGDDRALVHYLANVNHATAAELLADAIAQVRHLFGEQAVRAALDISRIVRFGGDDVTKGPG